MMNWKDSGTSMSSRNQDNVPHFPGETEESRAYICCLSLNDAFSVEIIERTCLLHRFRVH